MLINNLDVIAKQHGRLLIDEYITWKLKYKENDSVNLPCKEYNMNIWRKQSKQVRLYSLRRLSGPSGDNVDKGVMTWTNRMLSISSGKVLSLLLHHSPQRAFHVLTKVLHKLITGTERNVKGFDLYLAWISVWAWMSPYSITDSLGCPDWFLPLSSMFNKSLTMFIRKCWRLWKRTLEILYEASKVAAILS